MEQPAYLSAVDCERLLTPERAIELAELALRWEAAGKVVYSPARTLRMSVPDTGFHYHSKVVALPEIGVAGARIVGYAVAPDGSRPDAEQATRLIVLMDLTSGFPLAIVDEHYNYSLRTAASVASAVRLLHEGPLRLGVIGAGVVARASVRVMLAALDVSGLTLYSRTRERCVRLAALAADITDVAESAADVFAACDVVVMATTARAPILTGPLRPGSVVCAVGSNELDAAAYLSADRFIVDDWEQTQRAPDIAAMIAAGHPLAQRLSGTLPQLIVDRPRPADSHESVVIRTEGLASQDVLFAHRAWVESTQ